MSDGEFHAYVALLVVSGLVLSVLAVRGFGQSMGARVVDGLFSIGFLGYAAYLVVGDPATVRIFSYAFAVPIWAVVHVRRAHKAARVTAPTSDATPSGGYGGGFTPVVPQPWYPAVAGAGTTIDGEFTAQPIQAGPGSPPQPAHEAPFAPYSSYQDLPSGLANAPGLSWYAEPTAQHQCLPEQAQTAYPNPAPAFPAPAHFAPTHAAPEHAFHSNYPPGYPDPDATQLIPALGYQPAHTAAHEYGAYPQVPQTSSPGHWPPHRS
ncbi:hypothetical protein ODJ79_29110 [Actinoplanes sp. KI2]|uniref:hypothetical protein n=1 Tax=Actinoplanes sp. KI2 TaxID=2983315 RepID=UPI0021D59E69|nr:hypothetical protein [Actinoplanes sp. KI2]MCU7727795.1 hypothetical protein [Actinoplanes sp. KI2]